MKAQLMSSIDLEPSPDLLTAMGKLVNDLAVSERCDDFDNLNSSPFKVIQTAEEPVRRRLRRSMSARSTREGFPIDLQTPPPSARTPQIACRTPSIIGPVLPVVDVSPYAHRTYELGVPVDLGAATPHWAWHGVRSGSASPRTHINPTESSSRPGTPGPMMPVALMRNMSAGQMFTVQSSCTRTPSVQAPVAQATTVGQASFTPEMRFQATPVTSTVLVNRTPLREVRCASVVQSVHRAGGTPMRARWPSPAVHIAR